jgi:hypothetical protein
MLITHPEPRNGWESLREVATGKFLIESSGLFRGCLDNFSSDVSG